MHADTTLRLLANACAMHGPPCLGTTHGSLSQSAHKPHSHKHQPQKLKHRQCWDGTTGLVTKSGVTASEVESYGNIMEGK